jgi:hypothetical protein
MKIGILRASAIATVAFLVAVSPDFSHCIREPGKSGRKASGARISGSDEKTQVRFG